MGTFAIVLAELQERLTESQAENAIIGLLVACGIAMVLVLRAIQKATVRLLLLGLIFVLGIGLWVQREELQDCRGSCTCRILGQNIDMPGNGAVNCER